MGLTLYLSASVPASDFAAVVPGRPLVFPADTGAHPDYRTEWWYITGWLTDGGGAERGFQVTFFRVATGIGADNPSRFTPRQLILAHAAIADPATGHLLQA
ncbi:MAG: lipocalin-like domain-containing protein, partial [Chromatiaceae bacterium]